MSRHPTNPVSKFTLYILLLFILMLPASCSGKTETAISTSVVSKTASPSPTVTPQLEPSPTPTATQWQPEDPTLAYTIGKGTVCHTAWSPDKTKFAISATDAIRVYQADTHEVLAEFPPQEGVPVEPGSLEFSPDGNKLIVETSYDVFIYDLQKKQQIFQIGGKMQLCPIAFKADSSGFALVTFVHFSVSDPGISWIDVYDFNSEEPLYEFDKNLDEDETEDSPRYRQVAFSSDGRWLSASDSRTGQVKTWDMSTGEPTSTYLDHPNVYAVAYSPDGNWLATGGGDKIRIWSAKTNSLVRTINGFTQQIFDLSFSTDSIQLTVELGDDLISEIDTTEVYEVSTGKKINAPVETEYPDDLTQFLDSEGYIEIDYLPVFSPDSSILIIPGASRLVVWDFKANKQKFILDTPTGLADTNNVPLSIKRMTFDPDGILLAVCLADGSVDLWDVTSGQRKLNIPSQKATTVAFSADGKYLAIGGKQMVELWDIQSEKQLWQTYFSGLWIKIVEFSEDNQSVLATDYSDIGISWLNLQDGHIWQSFKPSQVSSDSFTLALQGQLYAIDNPVSYSHKVWIWNLTSRQVLQKINANVSWTYSSFYSFNTDGRLIAGESDENTKIWSTVTGVELFEFPEGLKSPVFSPDEKWIVLSYEQRHLQVWDVSSLAEAPPLPEQVIGTLPTPAATTEANQGDRSGNNCKTVQPSLSTNRQLSGRLVMDGISGFTSYTIDLDTGEAEYFSDDVINLSTSPDGEWLAYEIYQSNTGEGTLVFENSTGKQRTFPEQEDWLFPQWLDNDLFSFSLSVDSDSFDIPGTQLIDPVAGPFMRLPSDYPDLHFYIGVAGTPYHYQTRSVAYNPNASMVVYEKTDEQINKFMTLYDRVNGKEVASFQDYDSEHYSENPIWSADGQFFIALLANDCCSETWPSQTSEELFRINRDGSAEQLTHFEELYKVYGLSTGSISPDGKKFSFHLGSQSYGDSTLQILDLDTKDITDTCLLKSSFSDALVWSPDSKYLVVSEEYESRSYRTILIDMETMQAEQVTDDDDAVPVGWLNAP